MVVLNIQTSMLYMNDICFGFFAFIFMMLFIFFFEDFLYIISRVKHMEKLIYGCRMVIS